MMPFEASQPYDDGLAGQGTAKGELMILGGRSDDLAARHCSYSGHNMRRFAPYLNETEAFWPLIVSLVSCDSSRRYGVCLVLYIS